MVARIAVEGGLSARETEVLGYLARGRSQPYIRDALVLSKKHGGKPREAYLSEAQCA